ncbi:MAG: DUF1232 domain-containing protein [Lachnospiraceae bacterium]|nr:DUF1232 domain-containing protein [Lachnospiraceae bacterium]
MATEEKVTYCEEEFITNERAKKLLTNGFEKAEETLNDEDKLERLFQRLEKKFESIPVAGSALKYIPIMASMVNMYSKKLYTDVPVGVIVAAVSALIYVVTPTDLIPDIIPAIGLVDDAAVFAACLYLVKSDLDEFRNWRRENGYDIDDLFDYTDKSSNAEIFARVMSVVKHADSANDSNGIE